MDIVSKYFICCGVDGTICFGNGFIEKKTKSQRCSECIRERKRTYDFVNQKQNRIKGRMMKQKLVNRLLSKIKKKYNRMLCRKNVSIFFFCNNILR